MDPRKKKRISKLLSLVLRHKPQAIGIQLDDEGWVPVEELLQALARERKAINRDQLNEVVATNDKQRFSISEDGLRIRAKQGHSIEVELGLEPVVPPEFLCHGTPQQFVTAIRESGLKKMKRHHVHMHPDRSLAVEVGSRRGKPVLLVINSRAMHEAGYPFFVTENDVWLTDHVPPEFIDFPDDASSL